MNKKIIYIALAVIFIISLIITVVTGLEVDLNYTQGHTVTFTVGKQINMDDIEKIANEIFGKNQCKVQKVELFDDSALIKTKNEITPEQLESLCSKLNEKYEVELSTDSFAVSSVTNVRLRNIIEPYIIPIGITTLLVVGYYAVRFKGVTNMLELLKYLVIAEGLLYSLYAIGRVKVNELTMPLALVVYTLVIIIYTVVCEIKSSAKKKKNTVEE